MHTLHFYIKKSVCKTIDEIRSLILRGRTDGGPSNRVHYFTYTSQDSVRRETTNKNGNFSETACTCDRIGRQLECSSLCVLPLVQFVQHFECELGASLVGVPSMSFSSLFLSFPLPAQLQTAFSFLLGSFSCVTVSLHNNRSGYPSPRTYPSTALFALIFVDLNQFQFNFAVMADIEQPQPSLCQRICCCMTTPTKEPPVQLIRSG